MPKFGLDEALKKHLLANLKEKYGEEREPVHESDCIYCLRSAYWNYTDPAELTPTALLFFSSGENFGETIELLSGYSRQEMVEAPFLKGLYDTVDMIGELPIEFKTTRSFKRKGKTWEDDMKPHYTRQLAHHCLFHGAESGILAIEFLMRTREPFLFVRVDYSAKELKQYREELVFRATLLQDALRTGDIKDLPRAFDDCKWKCKYCSREYKERCDELFGDRWKGKSAR